MPGVKLIEVSGPPAGASGDHVEAVLSEVGVKCEGVSDGVKVR